MARRWTSSVVVIVGVFFFASAALISSSQPAAAWSHHGCEWGSGPLPSITYTPVSLTSTWSGPLTSADYWWDDRTSDDLYFVEVSNSSSDNFSVYDSNYADNWRGLATWVNCPTGFFTTAGAGNYIQLNTRTAGGFTYEDRRKIVSHEMGHLIGLDHVIRTCGSTDPAVMVENSRVDCSDGSNFPPFTDDIQGFDSLY